MTLELRQIKNYLQRAHSLRKGSNTCLDWHVGYFDMFSWMAVMSPTG